jgi:hypothetical protein
LTQPGDLVLQVTGPDGPERDVFKDSHVGIDNGTVFDLPPEKIKALSASLTLADGTTHSCSAEPFRH